MQQPARSTQQAARSLIDLDDGDTYIFPKERPSTFTRLYGIASQKIVLKVTNITNVVLANSDRCYH
jgi:hypothetical protein